ncbi:hypothetical protein [Roseobacter litoralis]|uniref:Uncharacterized protein n=1 Tax=Roseobacter litoralis (strain ATCC 49566 / DSM 6996 / JCM 21268 / NBRC 15278 / OCh 149) TaxID=391595 RepID=F7ZH47_ROSLO|nr:hypothetical protein [Roseobacter litoralis]AEI94889.1 hypothetical protein RLO149_c029330 [Roseobacter litoralis Och 149]
MAHQTEDEVLARVAPSMGRRILGIGMLSFLAVLVIYVAIVSPPSLGWQVFLIALGAGSLTVANAMRKSTRQTLELTRTELRDDAGTVLVRIEDISSIDRGAFAFKPSNGFLLRLTKPHTRDWRPGLWWRSATRVGVGGMTPMRATKYMGEIIAIMLAEREQKD